MLLLYLYCLLYSDLFVIFFLFQARMETVISVIEENLSCHGVTISHPQGGYFLWVKLPEGLDSAKVLEISKAKENLTFVKGNL